MQMESIALFIAALAIVLCFLYIYVDGEHEAFEVGNWPFCVEELKEKMSLRRKL